MCCFPNAVINTNNFPSQLPTDSQECSGFVFSLLFSPPSLPFSLLLLYVGGTIPGTIKNVWSSITLYCVACCWEAENQSLEGSQSPPKYPRMSFEKASDFSFCRISCFVACLRTKLQHNASSLECFVSYVCIWKLTTLFIKRHAKDAAVVYQKSTINTSFV